MLIPLLRCLLSDCAQRLSRSLVIVGEIGSNDFLYSFSQGKSIQEVRTYVPSLVRETIEVTRVSPSRIYRVFCLFFLLVVYIPLSSIGFAGVDPIRRTESDSFRGLPDRLWPVLPDQLQVE